LSLDSCSSTYGLGGEGLRGLKMAIPGTPYLACNSATLQTEVGKRIQERTGAATVLVNRWMEELGEKILEEFEPEGASRN